MRDTEKMCLRESEKERDRDRERERVKEREVSLLIFDNLQILFASEDFPMLPDKILVVSTVASGVLCACFRIVDLGTTNQAFYIFGPQIQQGPQFIKIK